ncbi:unnamed protein product [Oppiella nova]|uniref:UDP-glycosyltransferase n=1 Tax=Oppiella nova TaxID=334625 RepID=A0A7R9M2F9_9ACAR|nr:unnamed protein product [Oppiella nova]CAG2169519.1 unnamed protein product [Oppiella nova]
MSKNITVLFAPIHYVGAVNSSIGMAEVLRDGGHRCIFAVNSDWRARLESMGFEVRVMGEEGDTSGDKPVMDSMDRNAESAKGHGILDPKTPLEKALIVINSLTEDIRNEERKDPYLRAIIQSVRPDVIISDHMVAVPAIITSGIPWVYSWSNSPLSLDFTIECQDLPPSVLGLAINSDPKLWQQYRKQLNEAKAKVWYEYRDWLVSKGCPTPRKYQMWIPSPYANFYMTPKELDYTDIRKLPDNYYGFDCFKRTGSDERTFDIPEPLRNRSGKLVYLSLGSMGSANVDLMKRLVSIMSKSEHRFIVSKGVFHDKFSLADNMWGERSVPQIKVLPMVDLIVTHGGNNTLTESMYFGKPMIVLPLFFDQFDNAQRVQEMGFGVRLDPFRCSEQQLLDAINSVLNDQTMAQKCKKASMRIQSENSIEKINDIVESLVK